jgi:FkbM family methyltransferase
LHPVWLRPGTTDVEVFRQVFIRQEYAPLIGLRDVGSIIDLGANVGCTSAYLLSAFPQSSIIAVEPDPDNFAVLQRNLAPYAGRATAIQAGVWSHSARLAMRQTPYRGGGEWARQVEESPDVGTVRGIDMPALQQLSRSPHTSLLKVDIEGSEAILFGPDCHNWLATVDAIAIELHDDSIFGNASDLFLSAIEGRGFVISHSGELTICRRVSPVRTLQRAMGVAAPAPDAGGS